MVCFNKLTKNVGQTVFLGNFYTVLNVSDDDQLTHSRRKFGMPAGGTHFIFDKVVRFVYFSDVVIISAHPAKQSVSRDRLGCGFGY